jgi:hypothetical protein
VIRRESFIFQGTTVQRAARQVMVRGTEDALTRRLTLWSIVEQHGDANRHLPTWFHESVNDRRYCTLLLSVTDT